MSTELNITIDQGSTWIKSITWQNSEGTAYDLSTWEARMMIRKHYADNDKNSPLIYLTNNDGITLGAASNNVIIVIEDNITESIPGGTYYYDVELISPSQEVSKLLRGKVFVLPEVTR